MSGLTTLSCEQMLQNPNLISRLPPESLARSLLESRIENVASISLDKIRDKLRSNLSNEEAVIAQRALSILRSSRPSLIPAGKAKCPEYEQLLKLADEVGFTREEKAFIQLHVIGGKKYIFVGEQHTNNKFFALFERLMTSKNSAVALFRENICADEASSKKYTEGFTAGNCDIFGLEGAGHPLFVAVTYCIYSAKQMFASHLESFLSELHFNTPWLEVLRTAGDHMPTKEAEELLEEIKRLLAKKMSILKKCEKLSKIPPKTWANFFLGLYSTCESISHISDLFSSSERGEIEALLEDPASEKNWERFEEVVAINHRNRSAAKTLFSHTSQNRTTPIVMMGYNHIPGIVAELERLVIETRRFIDTSDKKKA